jgi:hypothetical protein
MVTRSSEAMLSRSASVARMVDGSFALAMMPK